jgi:hypothetical protein
MVLVSKQYDKACFNLKKEKAHWILSKKNESYDIVFIGSSRVFNTIDPVISDSILKLKSINLGVGGATYPEVYLLLDQFLRTNHIKTALLQVDMWGIIPGEQAYGHPFSEEKYLHLIGDKTVDSIYLRNSNPIKFYFRKYVPFFKYSEYNSIYSAEKMLFGINPTNKNIFSRRKGAILFDGRKKGVVFNEVKTDNLKKINYNSNSTMSLRKIIERLQSGGIKVVLLTSPSYKNFVDLIKFNQSAKDTIVSIANHYQLPYFDFERHAISSDSLCFRDYTHLNSKGGHLFTSILCDTLKKYNYAN